MSGSVEADETHQARDKHRSTSVFRFQLWVNEPLAF
jgi:hypothetical protein